ncbi:MAG TPA: ABC transporter transmembrane domain-containing protein [Chloroflexia bacterium]|jgi:ABC-type multidrug transport system fused ATPase/permease subunit|nr:ABC transporter transmembrane domain-containing protein [Chloroflexia bacterium]
MTMQAQSQPARPQAATQEGPTPSARVLLRLWEFIRPDRARLLLVLGLALVSGIAAALAPYLITQAINGAIPQRDTGGLLVILLELAGVMIAGVVILMFQIYLLGLLAQRSVQRMQIAMMNKLNQLDIAFFDSHMAGDLISRVTGDLNKVGSLFGQGFTEALGAIIRLLVVVVAMLTLDWRLALASFIVIPMIFWSTLYLSRRTLKTSIRARATMGAITAAIQQELAGIRVTQAFNRGAVNQNRFRTVTANNRDAAVAAIRWIEGSTPMTNLFSALSLVIVLGFGTYLALNGLSSIGVIVAFILYVQQFNFPIQQAANLYNSAQGAVAATTRVYEILDTPVAIRDRSDAVDAGEITGDVAFEHVSFGYKAGQDALRDVSFTIPAGKTVAVVGPSGAGKSTLVNLLVRLYDVGAGRITVDGHDVRELTQASLRRHMAIILQQSTLFAGTIASNIRYGRLDATQEEIEAAARAVNAHDFITRLPQGYNTPVGPRGASLSEGQRQQIVFARALVRDPRILIMDEATSTLDRQTERLVQDAVLKVLANRTSLVVAHRLSTVRHADQIVVFDQGRVVESGTHDELMAAGGLYAKLVAQQAGEALNMGIDPAWLAGIPLFAGLAEADRTRLARLFRRESYAAGEDVVRQGNFGGNFYLIGSGRVEVLVNDGQTLRHVETLGQHDYFGEIALIAKERRTATVRAIEPAEVYTLGQADFADLLEHEPSVAESVSATVTRRRTELAGVLAAIPDAAEPVEVEA